jgi:hypothetical protein
MHWDVVYSEQIEDFAIKNELGLFNWINKEEKSKGLNSLVNERITDSNWFVFQPSGVTHGIEDGSEIYAQELILIDGDMPHWSGSDEKIYKVVSAPTLSSSEGKIGLIEIVNKELSQGWSLGKIHHLVIRSIMVNIAGMLDYSARYLVVSKLNCKQKFDN